MSGAPLSEDEALIHIAGAWAAYYNNFPSLDGPVTLWFANASKDREQNIGSSWGSGGNVYTALRIANAVAIFLDRYPVDEEKEQALRERIAKVRARDA
jgi:hypothetical protein